MKPEIAKRWVEALRSGVYFQNRGTLKYGINHFCCLGVLCDIAKNDLNIDWKLINSYNMFEEEIFLLPMSVKEWSGMKTQQGKLNNTSLVYLNDEEYTFEQIADVIEQNVDVL